MSRLPCIAIPFKKTAEADWVRPLRQYIGRTLQDDPEAYSSDCQVLQRMRQDVRGAKADTTGRNVIYRYHTHLEALEHRFHFGEQGVKMAFQWSDAFTGETVQQHSLAFEKGNVMFNLAVAFAMQGASLVTEASADSDAMTELIFVACKYFQTAADLFHFISNNFMHPPLLDLDKETTSVLDSIMLAQAQEGVVLKSQLEKKKDITIAQIAYQAALMYTGVVDSLKAIVDTHHLPRGWLLLAETKMQYYQAMAQYHGARVDNAKGQYGLVIARFSLAEQHAREATKLVGQFSETFFSTSNMTEDLYPENVQGLQDMITALAANISDELARATRDNDIVYNESVPNVSALPPLEGAVIAKRYDVGAFYKKEEPNYAPGPELFARLVPMAIHEGASVYSEEKAKLIRTEEDKVNLADGELQDALSFMKLPEGLRRFERQTLGPDAIAPELVEPSREARDAAYEIQSTERANPVAELRAMVEGQRTRANDDLGEIKRLMDEEQRASEGVLSDYASEPLFASYQPSSRAASYLREQILDNQKKLEDAAGLDNSILSDYRSVVAPWLPALQTGADGITSILLEQIKEIDADSSSGPHGGADTENLVDIGQDQPVGLSGHIRAIQDIYDNLLDLKSLRRSTLGEMKAFARDDDISSMLVKLTSPEEMMSLFEHELHKYDAYVQRLQTGISKQGALVKRISEEFRSLLELPQARSINKRWDIAEGKKATLESQALEAVQVYRNVRDGLDKANQFYGLLLESLGPLRREVSKFSSSRTGLREQLMKQVAQESAARNQATLQERLSQYSSSSHPQGGPSQDHYHRHHQQPPQAYQQQPYQPQAMQQPSYPPQQQQYQNQQPSPVAAPRASDPYDVGHLANQAAHMSLNSPSGEPSALPPMQQHQGYSVGGPQAPHSQPSAPPPPPMAQQQHYAPPPQQQQQHYAPPPMQQQAPPQQQQPMQHQQQYYQPPQTQQQHQPPPHEYRPQMQSVDSGYSPNVASGQYGGGAGHMPPADAQIDPYSAPAHRHGGPEASPINPAYKPGYGGYPPTAAPIQPSASPANGYGSTGGGYGSGAPVSGPAYASVSHSTHHQPIYGAYGEPAASMSTPPPPNPAVTAYPMSNGYAPAAYPPASQGPGVTYTNMMSSTPQQHPFRPAPQEPHPYKAPPQQQQQPPPQQQDIPPHQAGAYSYHLPAEGHGQQPPPGQSPYGAPGTLPSQGSGPSGSAGYQPQQQFYAQHQNPPPPQHYAPPPQQPPYHSQPPPQAYSYAYSAPQGAPASAPYGGPLMASQPPPSQAAAAAQYGYGQQPGYAPPPPAQQPPQQQQFQHGYGGSGSLMD
ncbi:bck1-like resistance to osmotic shock [Coemansia sp. RSA 552]|nr:bck1-like resistance to osmotic shock [Coemansia sp. RSA 552]